MRSLSAIGLAGALFCAVLSASLAASLVETAEKQGRDSKDVKWKVKRLVIPDGDEPEWADNSFCYVCHVNYEEEDLTMVHEEAGVGCETCHGMSMSHSQDEDNLTAPEIMWAKPRINNRCMTCHLKEDLLRAAVASEHRPFFKRLEHPGKAEKGERHCTECHAAEHKLAHRTRTWDRETGKLLKQSGGPAMDRQAD